MTPTILFTTQVSGVRDVYFPRAVLEGLEALGEVRYNETIRPLSSDELAELLPGVDVCVTHWGCPRFTSEVLAAADRLALVAHAGGSVADLVSEAVYDRGITVTSANDIMARHVAEGVLADILADLHRIPERSRLLRDGGWLAEAERTVASLSALTLGLVGLGAVGRELLRLAAPFAPRVLVHDPFVADDELVRLGAEPCGLDALLTASDIVSLHASLTADTRGMLDARRLALIRDGALLVNTGRAPLIDRAALLEVLASGRIRAVLDVFETEPLPADDPLRSMPTTTLLPHSAGSSGGADFGAAAVDEVARWTRGEAPRHAIPLERWRLMTREH